MKMPEAGSAPKKPARRRTDADAFDALWAPPPEAWPGILQERARALAQEPARESAAESIEVVAFLLANETHGVETAYVREVYPLKELTPLPCTPPFVAGIVNVRGKVLSVIDIKQLFELPAQGLTDLNRLVILSDGAMEFGILADAILGVRQVPLADIQPGLPTLTAIREEFLKGLAPERMVILDAAKLLRSERIVVHEQV